MLRDSFDADVAVVGYGPVGQTLTALLAARGHSVAVYERYPDLYDLPRALYFDDEIKQVWQALGVVDEIADDLLPVQAYEWLGADGDPIARIEHPELGPSGWASGYVFYQPSLERALDRAVRALPSARVHQGCNVEALEQAGDHVALTVRNEGVEERVRARYVVGADGANSLVRQTAGIPFDDQGFAERWLVVDLRPDDMEKLSWLPSPCQWCDPERPHMHSRNGRRHRRFEFMLLPGEYADDFADEERVWELLEPWFAPSDGVLVRHTVYEFRGRLARTMRSGRVLLAGDAAHTMPPFMGQGLCSGVRDAANLAWRLDLMLRGVGDDRLLDTYATERRAQNEWIVNLSTEMGRVSCTLDPDAAAERDAVLRAADAPPPLGLPPLHDGTLAHGSALAGVRGVQGHVRLDGREGRFDDVVGRGFVLLARHRPEMPLVVADALDAIGAKIVALDELEDLDGRLTAWLDKHRVAAVLVRPDAYVFGAVEALEDLPALVDDLRSHLSITDSRITAHVH
jgi:2-polyprenyl-6-methoxyphenol hydroxylase-like FAD-dependent oxidoreductase